MLYPSQDRLIRKEVSLGTIRELTPPQDHIGLDYVAPWKEVGSDDVIFDFARQMADGLAPARAEDAEAELAQKDVMMGGRGQASVIDWALMDHYTASDVARYREALIVEAAARGENSVLGQLPLIIGSTLAELRQMYAKDEVMRRLKLDNRIEWLIMTAVETGGIAYNDGKVSFSVNFGRPANQHRQNPAGGTWNLTTCDPIGDAKKVQEWMYEKYGVRITRAIMSRKIIDSIWNSDRFMARIGITTQPGGTPIDPSYLVQGWDRNAALQVFEQATGIKVKEYDAVYRIRPRGSKVTVNHRFLDDKVAYFLPDEAGLEELDDTGIGFAKTLTSPHPEGNWEPGFYEWEEEGKNPWGVDRGTGVKAFPIFLHMEKTYTMKVLPG